MALRQKLTSRGTMTVAPAGGLRSQLRLLNNKRTIRLYITVRATVQVTTLATSLRNKGNAAALLRLYVNENGKDRMTLDGRVASHLTACYAANTPTNTRQSALTVATYNLVERIVVHFSPRQAVVPSETCFAETSPTAPLFLEAEAYANGFARLFGGGAGSVSSLTVECEQEFVDEADAPLPFFVTTYREQIENVSGVNSAYPIFIRSANKLRGIVISQDSDTGEVSDILSTIALRADNGDIIGPNPVTYDNFAQMMENEMAGQVYTPSDAQRSRSHVFINFQQEGRLSRLVDPYRDFTNLRLEFGTTTSTETNPKVRITYIEMERPQPVDGRVLVTPLLPAAIA
jgi:hypothetical protein